MKILIIEDDFELSNELKILLDNNGYQGIILQDSQNALENIIKINPDLILLDIKLPYLNGQQLLKQIRKNSNVPIIMVTSKDSEIDEILAMSYGADDYITKPFNPLELMARVKTQLRRYTRYNTAGVTQKQDEEIDIRGMHISNISHKCMLNGQEIALTPLEFDIVWYLARKRGKVVSSEELFEAVWKEKYLDNNNTVMAHIARIRDKMHETARKPKFIKTVWGVGYTIE